MSQSFSETRLNEKDKNIMYNAKEISRSKKNSLRTKQLNLSPP